MTAVAPSLPEQATVTCRGQTTTLFALTQREAKAHGLPPRLLSAMAWQESTWNPRAVSYAGAEGLMQINPHWHPRMQGHTFDACASVHYAAHLIRDLWTEYGTLEKALVKYSGGASGYADNVIGYMERKVRG
ncbi:MAG: transglycosylase SLT domain-containing protein [Rhodospirillaceae bacterium]|nr:transglycosylase SLT domain-containing protein [Rhodospirillaceae bacterium]